LARAEREFQEEISRYPGTVDSYVNLGHLYLEKQKPEMAREYFERALAKEADPQRRSQFDDFLRKAQEVQKRSPERKNGVRSE
jgi:Tfp pilus assembly protein PilF